MFGILECPAMVGVSAVDSKDPSNTDDSPSTMIDECEIGPLH